MGNTLAEMFVAAMNNCKIKFLLDEPVKEHTTFRIGGDARVMVLPETTDEIKIVVKTASKYNLPVFVLGNGSNLLVSDKGIDGVVMKLDSNFSSVKVDGSRVYATSGAHLSKIANICMENSLKGFEFASGIPGTLGGAVKMNAGAYGGEMKDVILSVDCMDKEGNAFSLTKEQLDFSYRHSAIADDTVVLGAWMEFEMGDKALIKETMRDLNQRRKEKQPLEYPSAGSTFKRPEGYFAGKLIEDSGLKGYMVGGAQVSDKHCGFVINKSDASFDDVITLISHIKRTVFEKYGVELCEEVKIIK